MFTNWKWQLVGSVLMGTLLATNSWAEPWLVGHWTMDEVSGSEFANDSSFNSNHAELTNANAAASWVPGRVGTAVNLDGVDDFLHVPFDETLQLGTGDFTIALWAYLNSNGQSQNLVSYGQNVLGGGLAEISFAENKNVYGAYVGNNPFEDVSINTIPAANIHDGWRHVAVVRNTTDNTFKLYYDGQEVASKSNLLDPHSSLDRQPARDPENIFGVTIGKGFNPDTNFRRVDGMLDDVRIYADALTQAEILALPGGVGGSGAGPATEFNWNSTGHGDWHNAANWSPSANGAPPNDSNETAHFGNATSGPTTVIADEPVTVNRIELDHSSHSYALAGLGGIRLAATTASEPVGPSMSVTGDHEIQSRVTLLADTTVDVASGSTLEFNHRLNLGGHQLGLSGGGTVAINNTQNSDGGGGIAVGSSVLTGGGTVGGDLANENGGTVAPGNSPGTLAVDGDYTQGAAGTLAIEIAETAFDRLVVNGQANLAGTLDVTLLDGFAPSNGATFDILDFSSVSGDFDTLNLPTDFSWDVTTGILSVGSGGPGLHGDFNGNGTVDAADYTLWQDGLNTTYTQADYVVWRANFGRSAGGGASAAVPEPTCWMMLVITLVTMTGLSRRSARR
jgi:hypothetical protein